MTAMTNSLHIVCPHCHTTNRVRMDQLGSAPDCGQCKQPLFTGQPVALVKVDSLLYQVKPGAYLGQNYGRVTKISETEVVMREIVQDAVGEWIERVATLQLQENAK